MKLEVGMYVRGNGFIDKISSMSEDKTELFFQEKPIFSDGECIGYKWCYSKDILKASHNIIDLIEVGDYVNGERVWKDTNGAYFEKGTMWAGDVEQGDYLRETKIETIVTKEQFETMQYKVVEE